jgi:transglutaminase-like putative cysteine protease
MTRLSLFIMLFALLCGIPASGAESAKDPDLLVQQAKGALRDNHYSRAIMLLDEAGAIYRKGNNLDASRAVTAEIYRLKKVMLEYSLLEGDLEQAARKGKIPLAPDEIKRLIAEDALEYMVIDGRKRFFDNAMLNAFFRREDLFRRHKKLKEGYRQLLDAYRWLIFSTYDDPDGTAYRPYGSPVTFLGEAEIKIKKKDLPSKGLLRLWVPYPITTTSQTDVRLLSVSHPDYLKSLPDPDASLGCIYFEVPLPFAGEELAMEMEYRFTQYAVNFEIDPAKVGAYDHASLLYRTYTRSDADCLITPEITALAKKIVGDEKNPYRASRKIYDYVVDNVKYSLMPHLSLGALEMPESSYVYEHHYGDCGAQSLFFSALCRAVGIPARCCGGMQLAPKRNSCHFWAQVYIPGYGWVPVDTSIAQAVMSVDGLTSAEKNRIRDFFFGSMDPYRLYIQNETDLDFYPPKNGQRLLRLAFQYPDAQCDGSEIDPALIINYATEFRQIR